MLIGYFASAMTAISQIYQVFEVSKDNSVAHISWSNLALMILTSTFWLAAATCENDPLLIIFYCIAWSAGFGLFLWKLKLRHQNIQAEQRLLSDIRNDIQSETFASV